MLLRLKAILERCANIFYSVSEDADKYFTNSSYTLGKRLKINEKFIEVHVQSFIRGHTIFQFSKIISLISTKTRELLKLPPYVTINTGNCYGTFLHLNKLAEFDPKNLHKEKNYVLFLKEADGTEEIPIEIKGIILSHDLPILSHLAIRARQSQVVFISIFSASLFKSEFWKQFKNDDFVNLNVGRDENIKIGKVDPKKGQGNENEQQQDGDKIKKIIIQKKSMMEMKSKNI